MELFTRRHKLVHQQNPEGGSRDASYTLFSSMVERSASFLILLCKTPLFSLVSVPAGEPVLHVERERGANAAAPARRRILPSDPEQPEGDRQVSGGQESDDGEEVAVTFSCFLAFSPINDAPYLSCLFLVFFSNKEPQPDRSPLFFSYSNSSPTSPKGERRHRHGGG